jgi:hypothetical protein
MPQVMEVYQALHYLTLTRLDIAFSINKVHQFVYAFTSTRWTTVKRILRYIKQTTNLGLQIKKSNYIIVNAFHDAYWENI